MDKTKTEIRYKIAVIVISMLFLFSATGAMYFGRKAFILDGERKEVWCTQYKLNEEVKRATELCNELTYAKLRYEIVEKPLFDSIANNLEKEYDLIRSGDFKLLANKYRGGISLGGN